MSGARGGGDGDRLRAALVQAPHLPTLDENLARAAEDLRAAADAGARLVLLPEYFWTPAGLPTEAVPRMPEVRAFLAARSRALGLAVAANVLEPRGGRLRNVGVVYDGGGSVLEQDKIHPMPREAAAGVAGGDRLAAAPVAGVPTGMLVCADILYPEAARILGLQGAEVLLNPVMSPYKEEDLTRGARDSLFVARAYDSGAFVLKAGGFRRGGDHGVAGRSLAAAPWGLLARARDDFGAELLVADLDLAQLRAFRASQAKGFPPRRPEAYRDLVEP